MEDSKVENTLEKDRNKITEEKEKTKQEIHNKTKPIPKSMLD